MRLFSILALALTTNMAHGENRLAQQSSPYLQQHADNPVDWYPWGDEALNKAKAEGKMLFVSIGYASCHWCHVMEEESFENEAIAALLNEHFISIKIDRERRPDLDEQFIMVTSALTGSAGWPNSIFMTPDAEPFYAGTYFPPANFTQLINTIADVWKNNNAALRAEAFTIASRMRNYLDQTAVLGEVSSADINAAATDMLGNLDEFYGGFGSAPKFPRESALLFLLDQAQRTGDSELLNAVTLTLDGMIKGGIHDHVGGGFHRYSVDPEWGIPHFEKMLYNQALIGRLLLRAYSATGNADYARAARRTFDYVLREMQHSDGAFYAAQDADSLGPDGERVEGAFYAWTPAQIRQVLGDGATSLISAFNVIEQGTFEGANVLHLSKMPLQAGIDNAKLEKLWQARNLRPAPIKDTKIILAWNGEMIATLAEASRVLDNPEYGTAAVRAAEFLLGKMQTETGLKRIWFDGGVSIQAQLQDYAAFGRALLAVHDFSEPGATDWLKATDILATEMLRLFADPQQAMRMNAQAVGLGVFRPLDDNEIASGNAQALEFLVGLDRRLSRTGGAAVKLAAALAIDAINSPSQRAAILKTIAMMRGGPVGPMRVSNGGAVRVFATTDRTKGQIKLTVQIQDGWHINAHEPLEDYLVGMKFSIADAALDPTAYPDAEIKELGFSQTPLSLYEKDFVLIAPVSKGDKPTQARLTLQACNDQICLPPDEMVFWFW